MSNQGFMTSANSYFGFIVDAQTIWGMSLVLILSVFLGGLVGLEREMHGHPAGLRTHILVCTGATLMTLASARFGPGSSDRIAAQIVTGVGFLGAGAIVRDGTSVHGLTTAASVWVVAGIGITLGISPFMGQIATIVTVIVLFTLVFLNIFERRLSDGGAAPRRLTVIVTNDTDTVAQLLRRLYERGYIIKSVKVEAPAGVLQSLSIKFLEPGVRDRERCLADVLAVDGVSEAGWA